MSPTSVGFPINTESWDEDPDLVLPDGPLALIHSDTDPDPETSSSSLFSNVENHSLSSVGQSLSLEEHDPNKPISQSTNNQSTLNRSSLSSSSNSSECQQSTIKLSTVNLPSRSINETDHTVLTVLASGAQGTITRLESSKRPSPIQAGFDWDQDIVLPDGGLRAICRSSETHVKKKSSFASAISDELEDLHMATRSTSNHIHHSVPLQNKSNIQCTTVDEESVGLDSDFELPPSSQTLRLANLKHHSRTPNDSKPLSALSLDLDHVNIDPSDPSNSTPSSRRGSILRTTGVSNSTSTSMSLSVANRSSIDDTGTPRIRTRPSLTPSLMSDRSSSSFPENEDDINDGFFDDIEFPPEFGFPNSLSAPSSSNDTFSTPPNHPPKSTPPCLTDPKGKQSNKSRSVDLQSYLNSKIQARALIVERNNSSLNQQLRQNISTYQDRDDENVEDGLEINNGSIRPINLHSRKTSSMSANSSLAQQSSSRNSYFQQPHGHRLHHASSSIGSNLSQQSKSKRPSTQTNRSGFAETRITSPVPSSSTSTLPRRQSAPHTTLQITRPHSVIPPSVSHPSRHPTHHRPTSATAVLPHASGSKNFAYAPSSSLSASDSLPRVRTQSCQSTASDGEINHKHFPTASQTLLAPSGRVQSPLGPSSLGTNRLNAKAHQSSSLRTRVSTIAASSHGPPVLSASSQRTLKHKKSAAAIKSLGPGSSDLRAAYSSINSSSIASPPGSSSSSQRSLRRKQSMPSLHHSQHHSAGSGGLPSRLERADPGSTGHSSIWKSNLMPKSKHKHQLFEYASSPSSPTLPSGSILPSYADPTRASMKRHFGNSSTVLSPNGVPPDRSTSLNSRTSSSESTRMTATSPAPTPSSTLVGTVPVGSSRLTMPTIASRLKAKPSIIHEEHGLDGSHLKRSKTSSLAGVIPQQLRRPKRPVNYGDGTELDEFDDLPTSKEKEKIYTRIAVAVNKSNQATIKVSSRFGILHQLQSTGALANSVKDYQRKESASTTSQMSNQHRTKNRLETRKAEGARRRALAMNNSLQIKKNSSKKGLIRQMSGNALSKLSNNSEMRWNDSEARWEGNEHILREFDNALSTSSRPALISQLSIQSPVVRSQHHQVDAANSSQEKRLSSHHFNHKVNKSQNHVVGGMVFDSESMSWKKISGDDDEDHLNLESDEELELRWLADDESSSSKKHLPKLNNHDHGLNGGNIDNNWNSFSSSSLSLNQNHLTEHEQDFNLEDNVGECCHSISNNAKNKWEANRGNTGNCTDLGGKRHQLARLGSFRKACLEAEERHKKEIQSWIPLNYHSPNMNGSNSDKSLNPNAKTICSSKYGLAHHCHGRLTDSDRFYLQEIRKLVLEEEV